MTCYIETGVVMSKNEFVRERNQKLAQKLITALEKRHFNAIYCETINDVVRKIEELILKEETVSWGGSVTLEETGIKKFLIENHYNIIDRDNATTPEEKNELTKKGLLADVFLMSTNALSEDGQLVNIDGTGNRVAALCYGPKRVIVIAGMNKISKSLTDAIVRARTVAAPINQQRINSMHKQDTPCVHNGSCADCTAPDSICSQIVVTRLCKPAGKITVILVNEELGY